ncbi:MAG: HD domain-containing protein [Chloroflexi bacterium]|nr:HD domain-containing protein [Chloroflexota bacterium]
MNPTGRLARIFRQAGFELYLVGGPVRDRIIGRPSNDLDFTTDARPDRVKVLARRAGASSIYTVGERFGTIGAVFETGPVEITTFRAESYRPGSRKPDVQFGDSLEADLSRRDFTINAMAQDVLSGRIVDPHGGLADLVAGRIRAVGTADDRFREDPLRVLRCVRFAAQLGFDIESGTLAAARRTASELRHVSAERIGAELNLTLLSPEPGRALITLLEIGVLGLVMPELIPLQQTEQEERRQHKDVFAHTMRVLSTTRAEPEIRWAALLHDVGKPQTKSIRNRRIRFFGHEEVGARMARRILRRLKFDGQLMERVTHIVRLHMRANAYEPGWTDGAVRRFILEAGEDLDALITLSRADITSYRPRRIEAGLARVAELEARCEHLQAERDVAALDSPLDGHALMELFDRPPGVWIKPIKQYLLDLVLDGELEPDDAEGATVLAKAFVRRHTEAADAIESEAHHAQR